MASNLPLVKWKAFERFIKEQGFSVMKTSNNVWEVSRFKDMEGALGIIYKNAQDNLKFTGCAAKAFESFQNNKAYSPKQQDKKKHRRFKSKDIEKQTILDRDGDKCFYCNRGFTQSDCTKEHLLEISSGGTNHLHNIVLAHYRCNQMAERMSIVEKIKLRERLHEKYSKSTEEEYFGQ